MERGPRVRSGVPGVYDLGVGVPGSGRGSLGSMILGAVVVLESGWGSLGSMIRGGIPGSGQGSFGSMIHGGGQSSGVPVRGGGARPQGSDGVPGGAGGARGAGVRAQPQVCWPHWYLPSPRVCLLGSPVYLQPIGPTLDHHIWLTQPDRPHLPSMCTQPVSVDPWPLSRLLAGSGVG